MRIRVSQAAGIFVAAAGLLYADGGALQFRKQSGPLIITVFSAPTPLRAGFADLSVLVEQAADKTAILDAAVLLQISKTGEPEIKALATRAQATNKLLYAARPELPTEGTWKLNVEVQLRGNTYETASEMVVLPEAAPLRTYWPYFTLVPVSVLLFTFNQSLKKRRRRAVASPQDRRQPVLRNSTNDRRGEEI